MDAALGAGRLSEEDASYWRKQLSDVGFTEEQARVLLETPGVELHVVVAQVGERGCDPNTCFDIFS